MLAQLFLTQTIQTTLNSYLKFKQAYPLPAQLISKTLGVRLKGLGLTFYIHFAHDHVQVSQGHIEQPDLMIAAPPFTLLRMACSQDTSQALQEPELELTGDATLALTFKQFLDKLDIDWDYYLSSVIGPRLSHKSQQILGSVKNQIKQNRQSCQNNLQDYIHYEINLTPTPQALEDFYQQIDELKMEVDLCASRLQHLQKRFKQKRH